MHRLITVTQTLPVEILREDDGRWSVICEALPGCASWGTTEREAEENIVEAIQTYVMDVLAERAENGNSLAK